MKYPLRGIVISVVALGVAFVLGVALFNFLIMPQVVQHDTTVVVPRLVGLDIEEASDRCQRVGLRLQVEDRRHSVGVPPDRVLEQAPGEAAQVKNGRTIRVHVSMGTEEVLVPELRGMTQRQATLQLENANLRVGRIAKIHSRAEGRTVQASRPAPGQTTSAGNSVDLLIAEGGDPEPYLMPNFEGRALDEVRALIQSRGFRVGRITYRSQRGVYPGTILEHYPAMGSLIMRGESIDLVAATPH